MEDLAALKKINIKEIWEHEARNFTPWLANNISALDNVLSMELELVQKEAPVGDFQIDLLAHDLTYDRLVVIENQFGVTDHQHLGKLLTYAAGRNAKAVVWISQQIRDEHRQAIDWLNQNTVEELEFFALELELLQIDDSRPAYHFRLVAFPNGWQKKTRSIGRKKIGERGTAYQSFFQKLIDELREKHHLTRAKRALPQNWCRFPTSTPGVSLAVSFTEDNQISTEVYIGRGDALKNKALFDQLFRLRSKIETQFGGKLDWQRMDEADACRIALYRDGSIEDDGKKLEEIAKWMIQSLSSLKKAFDLEIQKTIQSESKKGGRDG